MLEVTDFNSKGCIEYIPGRKVFCVSADVSWRESDSVDLEDRGEIRLDCTKHNDHISLAGSGTVCHISGKTVNNDIVDAYMKFELNERLNESDEELDID